MPYQFYPSALQQGPALTGSDSGLGSLASQAASGQRYSASGGGAAAMTPNQFANQQGAQNLESIFGLATTAAGPAFAQSDASIASLMGQMQQANALFQQQQSYTLREAGLQQELQGLQGQQLMYQQAAQNRQLPLLNKERGLQQTQDTLNRYMLAIQGRELGYQGQELSQAHQIALRQMAAQQAATGSLFTHGATDTRSQEALQNQLAENRLRDARDRLSIAKTEETLGEKGQQLSYNEAVSKLKDQQHNLDIASKQLGVDKKLLNVKVSEALTQLGLNRLMTTDDIYRAMVDANNGKYNAIQGILDTVLGAAQLPGMMGRSVTAGGGSSTNSVNPSGPLPSGPGGYVNPFGHASGLRKERLDMGWDFATNPGQPIASIGNAKVTNIIRNWYRGQPLVETQLLSGPDAGKFVYYAEGLNPTVGVGQTIKAGQTIGITTNEPTGLELGWGGTPSGQTLAQVTSGYREGQVTPAAQSFYNFLRGLGV